MKDLIFKVKNKDGKIEKFELLHTFTDNNINYMIYTDNTYNNTKDKLNIYASSYFVENGFVVLVPLSTAKEYDLVDLKIKEYLKEFGYGNDRNI